jgi:hypothetical protein
MTKLLPLLLLLSLSASAQTDTVKGIIIFPGVMTAGYWVVDNCLGCKEITSWYIVAGSTDTYSDTVHWRNFWPGTIYDLNFRKVNQRAVRAFYVPEREQPKLGF